MFLRGLASPFQHAAEDQDHGGRHRRRGCGDHGRRVRRHGEVPRHLLVRRGVSKGDTSANGQELLPRQQAVSGHP